MVRLKSLFLDGFDPDWIGESQFHYGSIEMESGNNPNPEYPKSQFHYGSIEIKYHLGTNNLKRAESQFHYGSIEMMSIALRFRKTMCQVSIPLWFD